MDGCLAQKQLNQWMKFDKNVYNVEGCEAQLPFQKCDEYLYLKWKGSI